jgi:hypothetical protein
MSVTPGLRKTEVLATIGPACDSVDTLKAMIATGMNVARLNLSFGTDGYLRRRQGLPSRPLRGRGRPLPLNRTG